jgi:hypothetical protein
VTTGWQPNSVITNCENLGVQVQIVFNNDDRGSPEVSIVLLDWSCRESFHILDYLAHQTVPREQYEVIWIEYYDRRAPQIEQMLRKSRAFGKAPAVDRWVIMGVPKETYYHKHLMYNAGIMLSRGEIVAICDSDAIAKESFVETIIKCFKQDSDIVLHLDQARNNDTSFYPFNYPTIDEVIGAGCINWLNGKTAGLWDTEDILHTRNYGACMAALRGDLIKIGGADEHIDYLGHVCGPYDMTFRLVNLGKREVWHPEEFLYHVWHPGQAGEKNYVGPHDGLHMSSRALLARVTGRILPFVENPAIRNLRLEDTQVALEQSLALVVSEERLQSWSIENIPKLRRRLWRVLQSSQSPITALRLFKTFLKLLMKQAWAKAAQLRTKAVAVSDRPMETKSTTQPRAAKETVLKLAKVYQFARRIFEFHIYATEQSRQCLEALAAQGDQEVSFYGTGDVAEIFYDLTFEVPLKIKNIYDDLDGESFHGFRVLPIENCDSNGEKLIITSLVGIDDKVRRLKTLGVSPERIVVLQ